MPRPVTMTPEEIDQMQALIEAIRTHLTWNPGLSDRLLGVYAGLAIVRSGKSYVQDWLKTAEQEIREVHQLRNGGKPCNCGVCRREVSC